MKTNDLKGMLIKAGNSAFYLWLLNFALHKFIPFNAPHKLNVTRFKEGVLTVRLPYIRKNQNHLKGMHASALATLCEYTCGLVLINSVDAEKFRLIMRSLEMYYEKQAREDVFCEFSINKDLLETKIYPEIKNAGEVFHVFDVEVRNANSDLICTAKVEWQLKAWEKVKK